MAPCFITNLTRMYHFEKGRCLQKSVSSVVEWGNRGLGMFASFGRRRKRFFGCNAPNHFGCGAVKRQLGHDVHDATFDSKQDPSGSDQHLK